MDDDNYGVAEVCDALRQAVQEDWRADGVPDFLPSLLLILQPSHPDMLPVANQLDALRPQADGHGIRSEILEEARNCAGAPWRNARWVEVVHQVLCRNVDQRKNQIVAHYRREAPARVRSIDSKFDDHWPKIEQTMTELAEQLAAGRSEVMALPKRDALDDGVPV